MAGDWIPIRTNLREDPAVIDLAKLPGIVDVDHAVGKLHRLWSWVDQQVVGEYAPGMTVAWLDGFLGVTGCGEKLGNAGWLVAEENGLRFPNIGDWLAQLSKRRLLARRRKRRQRSHMSHARCGHKRDYRTGHNSTVHKKKEDPPNPPAGGAVQAPASQRARNPIWDAVVEAFGLHPATKADNARMGRIVADLKAKGAMPEAVGERLARYRQTWPNMEATPEALVKHWDRFDGKHAAPSEPGRARDAGTDYDAIIRARGGS